MKEIKITVYNASECVPKEDGTYICWLDSYKTALEWYSEYHAWNVHGGNMQNEMFPMYWAPFPDVEAT